jgi:hypothetical protein
LNGVAGCAQDQAVSRPVPTVKRQRPTDFLMISPVTVSVTVPFWQSMRRLVAALPGRDSRDVYARREGGGTIG